MKKVKIACIVVFLAMLFGSAAISLIIPQKEYSDMENRSLEMKPKISLKAIKTGDYQERYENI